MTLKPTRRDALRALGLTAAAVAAEVRCRALGDSPAVPTIDLDLKPRYELSRHLFMQFMEPLGVTDSSVEAAWDHNRDAWREDVIEATRGLEPTMVRWGGIFTDYYRWREGTGPRDKRPTMANLMWGGLESNQVGSAEFIDFCRQVNADPLICVNFESDGRHQFKQAKGSVRTADAREAAEWVAYCNDPDNKERRGHGLADPLTVKFWQIGNETSYDASGFNRETAIDKTLEFAKAMRAADPSIKLVAWGDSGWAPHMIERTGDQIDLLAFHHMFNPDDERQPVLRGELYRRDPDATWHQLMGAWRRHDAKIREVRESLGARKMPLAMTECHFTVPGRNRCDVMSTWATGVAYGRMLNNHQRHGDVLKIATAADFCGTRWQVNALMIPVPHGKAYLMPVARVMRLYRHHIGAHAVEVASAPDGLDVVASRDERKLYLHVVNTKRERSIATQLNAEGLESAKAMCFEIVDDPMVEVSELNSDSVMQVKRRELPPQGRWEFPAASVSAVEIELAA
jgi:alpha-N-arabinofuranosidase